MAEASSGQDLPVIHSKNVRPRENDAVAVDQTVSSADLYRMCKKIAQLTKVSNQQQVPICYILFSKCRYCQELLHCMDTVLVKA